MANKEHLAILRKGVEAWNEWRAQHREVIPDLSGANLSASILTGVNLSGANLTRAYVTAAGLRCSNLSDAILHEAELSLADLRDANLNAVILSDANLTGADLNGADLRGANLYYAALTRTRLGCNLEGARFGNTVLNFTDLSNSKGLDRIKHSGPSAIDHSTLQASGQLPEAFLRGCGLSDVFIDNIRALFGGDAIRYYSCFISYSHTDSLVRPSRSRSAPRTGYPLLAR